MFDDVYFPSWPQLDCEYRSRRLSISEIDWKDTGSVTNNHVTLGKSFNTSLRGLIYKLTPLWLDPQNSEQTKLFAAAWHMVLWLDRVHLAEGKGNRMVAKAWLEFVRQALPHICEPGGDTWHFMSKEGIIGILQEMDAGPSLGLQLQDKSSSALHLVWVFHKLQRNWTLLDVSYSCVLIGAAKSIYCLRLGAR